MDDDLINRIIEKFLTVVFDNEARPLEPSMLVDDGFQPFTHLDVDSHTLVNIVIEFEDVIEQIAPHAQFKPGFAQRVARDISIAGIRNMLREELGIAA